MSARLAMLTVATLLMPSPVRAQETLRDVLTFLVTNRSVRTDDFDRDRAAADAARDTIARALLVNLTTMPLGTASGGFLYRLNPELGTVERASQTFGGFFVERALTAGAGRLSGGVSAYTTGFTRLDGQNLRDGQFVTVANQFTDETEPFDVDTLTLQVRSSVLTVFGSIGVTDRLEIGAAVPLINLRVEGERTNTYFGQPFVQASGEGTASGIGDVALRAKYNLFSDRGTALTAAFEWRLPTGNEANLLGTGRSSYRVMAVASYERREMTLHANGGAVLGGISNELDVAGAVSYAVRPRVTVSGELLVRRVAEFRGVELTAVPHPAIQDVETWQLLPGPSGQTLSQAVAGVKWNASGTLVVGAHVVFPLVHRGLTSSFMPMVGIEYGF